MTQKITLAIGFSTAIVGFLVAALTEYRPVGIAVFMIGFFVACIAIITVIFSTPTESFGRATGPGIKIAAAGFGVIALGQILEPLFKWDDLIGAVSFFVGLAIMLAGILFAVISIVK